MPPIPGTLSWEQCWRLCRKVFGACLPTACSVLPASSGSGSPTAALPLLMSWGLGFLTLREREPAVILKALTSSVRASHYSCHFSPKFLERGKESFAKGLCAGQMLAGSQRGAKRSLAPASGQIS